MIGRGGQLHICFPGQRARPTVGLFAYATLNKVYCGSFLLLLEFSNNALFYSDSPIRHVPQHFRFRD